MRPLFLPLMLLSVAGCGLTWPWDDYKKTDTFTCDPEKIRGLYLVSYTKLSGNCATPADQLTQIPGVVPGTSGDNSGCKVTSHSWAEARCRENISMACDGQQGHMEMVGYSTQANPDGSHLTGEMTLRAPACTATYDVDYERH